MQAATNSPTLELVILAAVGSGTGSCVRQDLFPRSIKLRHFVCRCTRCDRYPAHIVSKLSNQPLEVHAMCLGGLCSTPYPPKKKLIGFTRFPQVALVRAGGVRTPGPPRPAPPLSMLYAVYKGQCHKDNLKTNMQSTGINPETWEDLAGDKLKWWNTCLTGVKLFEENCTASVMEKRR